jgi:hypothetical protein
MSGTDFWKVIGLIDREALEEGDEEAAIAPLGSALAGMTTAEIESFDEHLAQALFAIDGESYADNAGDSGGSGDGFLYARCYVVAQGQEHYNEVARNAAAMPKSLDQWCESLLYVATNAWAEKTGNDPGDWEFQPSVSYETGSNRALWGSSQ